MKIYSIVIILLGILVGGCKEKSNKFDTGAFLERIKIQFGSKGYNDIVENIETAIDKNKNNQLDQTPVIIWAIITSHDETGGNLDIECYDEDKDLLGIGIKEKYIDSNGKETNLIEEYPLMYRLNSQTSTPGISVLVKIRNSNQRKSDQDWNDYNETEGNNKLIFITGRMSFPDIWISLPEPNKVEVEMYLYDKKGNKSNSIVVHLEDRW